MSSINLNNYRAVRDNYVVAKIKLVLFAASLLLSTSALSQQPLSEDERAMAVHMALQAHDRFLETWNTRDSATWSTSLNYPHIRPSRAPRFDLFFTPEESLATRFE